MHHRATARDHGIKPDHIAQRHPHTAQRHRQPRRRRVGQRHLHPGAAHLRHQPRGAKRLGQAHRRDIQRLDQRIAHPHGAAKLAVEILGRIGAECSGAIVDQRFGMGQPLIKGHAINQWLKRRSRRTQRLRHIHIALPGIAISGRAHLCQHRAVGMIGHHNRHRQRRPRARHPRGKHLNRMLQPGIDRRCNARGIGPGGAQVIGQMRRERGKFPPRRDGGGPRGIGIAGIDRAAPHQLCQHMITRRARGLGMAVGPTRRGRLRQRHQQRRLGRGQPRGFLAKPGARGAAHPFEIAAIGRAVQIERKDFILAQPPFQRPGQLHLPQFAAPGAGGPILQQARDLHRQRRSPRHDTPVHRRLPRRTHQGTQIDAIVAVKPLILIGDQHGNIMWIGLAQLDRQPPAAISHLIGAQQAAIAGQNLGRGGNRKRRQAGRIDPAVEPVARHCAKEQHDHQNQWQRAHDHGPMLTRPASVQARFSGR